MSRKYLLYLLRWQMSTPVLWAVIYYMHMSSLAETVIANGIGGLIFFWIDRWIFCRKCVNE